MLFILIAIFASFAAAASPYWPRCLTQSEAQSIATRWLSIFSTGGVTTKQQLATIVAPDLYSIDDTFGPPTTTLEELWEGISAGGNVTVTDVKQFPLFVMHTCDGIAVRWQYEGMTTGWNSYADYNH